VLKEYGWREAVTQGVCPRYSILPCRQRSEALRSAFSVFICSFAWEPMTTARWMVTMACAALAVACSTEAVEGPPADGKLARGTWGGDSAGVIVNDTITHVHMGCTYGDIPGRVVLDADGRFTVSGSYLLRAYPVAIGPTMPAQFTGRVSGSTLTITVSVRDTIGNVTVVRGPASVRLGTTPRMANCPICSTPGDRAAAARASMQRSAAPTPSRWYDWFLRW